MSGPVLALREAIVTALQANSELAGLMDGTVQLYDEAPRAANPVYAVFGDVTLRDWSGDGFEGHEQDVVLVVWSKPGSARPALVVAEHIMDILHEASLGLANHRLVSLRTVALDATRDTISRLSKVSIRLKALTEKVSII